MHGQTGAGILRASCTIARMSHEARGYVQRPLCGTRTSVLRGLRCALRVCMTRTVAAVKFSVLGRSFSPQHGHLCRCIGKLALELSWCWGQGYRRDLSVRMPHSHLKLRSLQNGPACLQPFPEVLADGFRHIAAQLRHSAGSFHHLRSTYYIVSALLLQRGASSLRVMLAALGSACFLWQPVEHP
jgi:hypothetical protein